ncbi:MAG: HEAT repeat domain-containing protein, partial [Verrucomicrobiota bacterium]
LHVIGGADNAFLVAALNHDSEYVRAWAVQLVCEDGDLPAEAIGTLPLMAAHDESPFVRLYLASAMPRLRTNERWMVGESLLTRAEDADDQNLPLMYWYGIEPLIHDNPVSFGMIAETTEIPLVRRFIGRRSASFGELEGVMTVLARKGDRDLLEGVLEGLAGQRNADMPKGWAAAYDKLMENESLRNPTMRLAMIFNDEKARQLLLSQAANSDESAKVRREAITALTTKQDKQLAPVLLDLIGDSEVAQSAIRALAEFNHAETAPRILTKYESLETKARQDALQTLASRAGWARQLLDAVEADKVAKADVTTYTARQIQSLKDEELTKRVSAIWGDFRAPSKQNAKLIADWKKKLTAENLAAADLKNGRFVFQKSCMACHKLFDEGMDIGPELTGAQRDNLDYVLENIIDPSASVSRDYRMEVVVTEAGRVLTGFLSAETEQTVTLRLINEEVIVPKSEIEERAASKVSMMPEGILATLSNDEVRDLIAYLASDGG